MRGAASVLGVVVALACDAPRGIADRVALPPPPRDGPALVATLAARRSVRSFAARPLTGDELGALLWAAQGQLDGHRTAPSAGALYPLTLWVADGRGLWRYLPAAHALERQPGPDRRAALAAASAAQFGPAPVVVIITAELAITAGKYGARAERYVTLEAGHAAQNLLLMATALGLGAVPIGAFDDAAVAATLARGPTPLVLYLIPVGAR